MLVQLDEAEVGITLIPGSWVELAQRMARLDPRSDASAWHDRLVSLREELGPERFEELRSRANAMSPRQITDYATTELDRLIAERTGEHEGG